MPISPVRVYLVVRNSPSLSSIPATASIAQPHANGTSNSSSEAKTPAQPEFFCFSLYIRTLFY